MLIILSIGWSNGLSCEPKEMLMKFREKEWINAMPVPADLYFQQKNKTFIEVVERTLEDDTLFCVLRYHDVHRQAYQIKQSNDIAQDTLDGWIITHKGNCGHCSSLQDLAVYLTLDLTTTVRSCGLKFFYSQKKQLKCIQDLGFTHNCALTWLFNTLNTKKECGLVCFYSYLTNQPFVVNNHLNRCLQCDEDRSGPIFKYMSGRTRRNSGIHSQIDRDQRQIYQMEHCEG